MIAVFLSRKASCLFPCLASSSQPDGSAGGPPFLVRTANAHRSLHPPLARRNCDGCQDQGVGGWKVEGVSEGARDRVMPSRKAPSPPIHQPPSLPILPQLPASRVPVQAQL